MYFAWACNLEELNWLGQAVSVFPNTQSNGIINTFSDYGISKMTSR